MVQYNEKKYAGAYNIGPNEDGYYTTGAIAKLFCDKWNHIFGANVQCISQSEDGPHEANFLKLDCSKFKQALDWNSRWNMQTTMDKILEWYVEYIQNGDVKQCMRQQIREYMMS